MRDERRDGSRERLGLEAGNWKLEAGSSQSVYDAAMIRDAVAAALFLAVVMTLGDYVWAALKLPHVAAYGIVHGAVMCLCFGLVIGWRTGRVASGAAAGPVIGVLAALVFYALAGFLRYSAMLPAWMTFWILFAFLQQWLSPNESLKRATVRGITAAVLSGVAFYAISGIWTRGSPGYHVNFAAWFVAFLPGFLALFWGRKS